MNSPKIEQIEHYDAQTDMNYQIASKIITILEEAGFEARMAGGCVRDRILGIQPKDYDVATSAVPETICFVFEQKGIKTVPTGIDHGTITVVMAGRGIEVTSLRKDVETDGRRAVVEFGRSFEEDSLRRDFSINAMYEDLKGQIYDFHNGREDLKNSVLRFVGDPRTRIREDYLRIMRLFRFWARFGFEPDTETLKIVREEVRGLEQISQERKTSELLLTLECRQIGRVITAMSESGCLQQVLGLSAIEKREEGFWSALYLHNKAGRSLARLAALLLNCENKLAQWQLLESLRLSRQQVAAVNLILDDLGPVPPNDPAAVFDWLDRHENDLWKGVWDELLLPTWQVIRPSYPLALIDKTMRDFMPLRVCPINGQFLIQTLKIKPGPELGAVLNELKDGYRRGQWNQKEQALSYVKKRLKLK